MILEVYKSIGESNGDIIKRIKQEYNCKKICFAGRLDPMAHGLVIVLTDEDVKNSDKYMYSGYKKYKFEFIVGFRTDSGDLLGLINKVDFENTGNVVECALKHDKQYNQQYHLFSSFLVNKKPLWWYGINGVNINCDLPSKQVNIKNIDFLDERVMTSAQLKDYINDNLNTVPNNKYRKEDIIECYDKHFANNGDKEYNVFSFDITVSSGFYVRQFVQDIADKLNLAMTTMSIYRYGFEYD